MSTWSDASDDELVNGIRDGVREAFHQTYARYALALLHYAASRTKSREDAEEIVQDIFVWLWSKREQLQQITSLKAYLYSAARHGILNYFRSANMRAKYAAHFTRFLAAEDNTIEDGINLTDLQHSIEREINQLPERCQVAFRLSRYEHLPIPVIAERMNISTGTVENYITTALKHLRGSLEKKL